jgi:hypothetical protein
MIRLYKIRKFDKGVAIGNNKNLSRRLYELTHTAATETSNLQNSEYFGRIFGYAENRALRGYAPSRSGPAAWPPAEAEPPQVAMRRG